MWFFHSDVDVVTVLKNIVTKFNIDASIPAIVYLAQDTRPSSDMLSAAVREGVEALGASVKDFHLLTTPQLHHIVNAQNSQFSSSDELDALAQSSTAQDASEEGYYAKISDAFVNLLRYCVDWIGRSIDCLLVWLIDWSMDWLFGFWIPSLFR